MDMDNCALLVSKGFSPNGDGENDFWLIEGILAYPDNNTKIFNRWGNLVFQKDGYDNDEVVWGGQSEGGLILGENEVPDGTYFYVIELGNGERPVSGYIVVKR
jgi:gliding motility-associated-like protein